MRFRKTLKITGRTSVITNVFVQAIIPCVAPTNDEIDEALAVLGQKRGAEKCVYCGVHATDWDHLHPLVRGKQPTGYFNEIRNLVPACGPCNQSKSGRHWRVWLEGCAKGSPRARGVENVSAKVALLERFEIWANLSPDPGLAGMNATRLQEYWERLARIHALMREAQQDADDIKLAIARLRAATGK